jgi:hypothetical protein
MFPTKKLTFTIIVPDFGPVAQWLWPYLVAAIAVIPSALWIWRDHTIWPWDQAWYGEVSVDLWYAWQQSFPTWLTGLVHAMGSKPPGCTWLAEFFVPFAPWVGSVEHALLLSILLTQFAILVLILKIGQVLLPWSRLAPVLGVLFIAGTPAFVSFTHQMLAEPLQTLSMAWVVLIAVQCEKWPFVRTALHTAGALALGAIAKTTVLAYCLLFFVYIAYAVFRKPVRLDLAAEKNNPSSSVVFVVVLGLVPAVGAWYWINLGAAWQHAREASSGEIALNYGFRASILEKLIVWIKLLNQSFLAPYLGLAFGIATVTTLFHLLRKSDSQKIVAGTWRGFSLLALLQVALVLLAMSASDSVESRFLYPLVIFAALLFMSFSSLISSRKVIAALFIICGWQWYNINQVALGKLPRSVNPSDWLISVQPDRSEFDELTRVVQQTSVNAGTYDIIGVEEPWMNANSAAFFAAKNRLTTGVRAYYTSLGYAEKSTATAVKRIDDLQTKYFITLDEKSQTKPPNFLNIVSLPVLKEVENDSRFERVPFQNKLGILIYKRNP